MDKAGMLQSSSSREQQQATSTSTAAAAAAAPPAPSPSTEAALRAERAQRASDVVYEMSKNSEFFKNEQRKGESTEKRALEMKERYENELKPEIDALLLAGERPDWMRRVDKMVCQMAPWLDVGENNQVSSAKIGMNGSSDDDEDEKQETEGEAADSTRAKTRQSASHPVFTHDLSRVYIHADLDCFFAAVAIRDDPELKGKPVGVGGMSMLSTASYEARTFGVRSAMPGFIAKKLCPDLIIVPADYQAYKVASGQTMDVLRKYDKDLRKMSLDEASLDITDYLRGTRGGASSSGEPHDNGDGPVSIARLEALCTTIMREVTAATNGLTVSLGCAPNRRIAKIAADFNKPNGFKIVKATRCDVQEFMDPLPVRKVSGVGKVSAHLLATIGIEKCAQLFEHRYALSELFSLDATEWFIAVSLGLGNRKDNQGASVFAPATSRKSVSRERTFGNITSTAELEAKARQLCEAVCDDICGLAHLGLRGGRCVSLKLKLSSFEVRNRAQTLLHTVPKVLKLATPANATPEGPPKASSLLTDEGRKTVASTKPKATQPQPQTASEFWGLGDGSIATSTPAAATEANSGEFADSLDVQRDLEFDFDSDEEEEERGDSFDRHTVKAFASVLENTNPGVKHPNYSADPQSLFDVVLPLLQNELPLPLPVRQMGVRVSQLQWSAVERARTDKQSIVNFFGKATSSVSVGIPQRDRPEPEPPIEVDSNGLEPDHPFDLDHDEIEEELGGADDEFKIVLSPSSSQGSQCPREAVVGTTTSPMTLTKYFSTAQVRPSESGGDPSLSCRVCDLKFPDDSSLVWRESHVERCLSRKDGRHTNSLRDSVKQLQQEAVTDLTAESPGDTSRKRRLSSTHELSSVDQKRHRTTSASGTGAGALDRFVRRKRPVESKEGPIEL